MSLVDTNAFDYINVLDKAADASWLRNDAISNNIANADTPGYKRQDVNFETQLAKALRSSRYTSMDSKVANVKMNRDEQYDIDDIILCEYGTTVVGLEMLRAVNEENAEENRKIAVVKSAISTLSFSEMEAITHIFDELNGMEGILVASKIADKVGITRSVIVNALRKFESAGVIESRSSGMKGTYIKVLNDVVFDEVERLKEQGRY